MSKCSSDNKNKFGNKKYVKSASHYDLRNEIDQANTRGKATGQIKSKKSLTFKTVNDLITNNEKGKSHLFSKSAADRKKQFLKYAPSKTIIMQDSPFQ